MINKEELLCNLKDNLKTYTDFYTYGDIPLYNDQELVYFNYDNPIYVEGVDLAVKMNGYKLPLLIKNIAYLKDDNYYNILTNKKITPLKVGYNKVTNEEELVSHNINKANKYDLYIFEELMKLDENINNYINDHFNNDDNINRLTK